MSRLWQDAVVVVVCSAVSVLDECCNRLRLLVALKRLKPLMPATAFAQPKYTLSGWGDFVPPVAGCCRKWACKHRVVSEEATAGRRSRPVTPPKKGCELHKFCKQVAKWVAAKLWSPWMATESLQGRTRGDFAATHFVTCTPTTPNSNP